MNTYLLYDPALNGAYTQIILQQQYQLHHSLFAGTKDEELSDVAPYVFQIDDLFAEKVLRKPLIELAATVLIRSDAKLEAAAAHLRQFIYQTINGREYFFRFWDARVLEKFLPTCSKDQIKAFFEGLNSLIMLEHEAADEAVEYIQERGRLSHARVMTSTIFGKPAAAAGPGAATPAPAPVVAEHAPASQKKGRTFLS